MSTGGIEAFVLGAYRPGAELVLRACTASAAGIRTIQSEGSETAILWANILWTWGVRWAIRVTVRYRHRNEG
jgi:hypothetical protein